MPRLQLIAHLAFSLVLLAVAIGLVISIPGRRELFADVGSAQFAAPERSVPGR